ncbi:hypothetical protein FC50_GL000899 [Lacticaseibacillus pantheris DSM 15945 = JCM 12539 = NBRC 106106]|uniref:Uncharacterized protein n=1 Tax=Lacticaseibacillus pantheris DSM 15945 = JCM 12539 = NBRC 106106 TaxID=1423783 RepID=A0A0R1TYW7_9LACO|nr:hypothetical protein [Lacticaseibacillus pantheris]KRL86380.1 hypothetical protein FC50_GL000899 [Lacticaseibacillus pantheris DSM 15945 = JCM 12539 = NBRC 106106]
MIRTRPVVFIRDWTLFGWLVVLRLAGRTGVVVPVERLVPATGAVSLTLTPVPGYRELP